MTDMMQFPDSVDEFMEKYKIIDTEQVYTNGAELVPIFRMRQWFERKPEQRWIPVTERCPEDLEEVNVTWVNHDPEPYYDFVKDKPCSGSAVYYKGSWYWYSSTCVDMLAEYGRNEMDKIDDGIEVLAWMPLPGPWKGGEA